LDGIEIKEHRQFADYKSKFTMVESTKTKLREQIEYYLSDLNLSRDKFFRDQIQADKNGWVLVTHFLNCNKIKSQKVTAAEIVAAVADSTKIELDTNKLSVRRKDNPALPEFQEKKRDAKAVDKKQAQVAKQHED
jgi:hypothetical protein